VLVASGGLGDQYAAGVGGSVGSGSVGGPVLVLPWGSTIPMELQLTLASPSATVFSSDALPTRLDVADFSLAAARIIFFGSSPGEQLVVEAVLTSVSVVPEPSSLLLGIGAAALAWQRSRRR
jgi:hypothetical protein